MPETVDRIAVHAAIVRLISEKDPEWRASASTVLDAAALLPDSSGELLLIRTGSGLPSVPVSLVFGTYLLLAQNETDHVVIMDARQIFGRDEYVEYRIFYDEYYEPAVMVRAVIDVRHFDKLPLNWRFMAAVHNMWERSLSTIVRERRPAYLLPWTTKQATVVYSAHPEWNPGDELPLE